eukprot:scaffold71293_cov31-Phaeocystis_antarctica.AAC.1
MHRQVGTVSRHGEPHSRSNHAGCALLGHLGPCCIIVNAHHHQPPAHAPKSVATKGGCGHCTTAGG